MAATTIKAETRKRAYEELLDAPGPTVEPNPYSATFSFDGYEYFWASQIEQSPAQRRNVKLPMPVKRAIVKYMITFKYFGNERGTARGTLKESSRAKQKFEQWLKDCGLYSAKQHINARTEVLRQIHSYVDSATKKIESALGFTQLADAKFSPDFAQAKGGPAGAGTERLTEPVVLAAWAKDHYCRKDWMEPEWKPTFRIFNAADVIDNLASSVKYNNWTIADLDDLNQEIKKERTRLQQLEGQSE